VFTREDAEAAFGPHPMADWKPKFRKGKRWYLQPDPNER
jgi:hypothetical protein